MMLFGDVFRGFRFGMLLQLSVGPVCLFIFRSAGVAGFWAAIPAVLAVALVDAAYILLAGTGVAAALRRPGVTRGLRVSGSVLLALFGADMILGALGLGLLPSVRLFADARPQGLFAQALLLTASNPLTILFWSGVFAAQAAARPMGRRQLLGFGLGCVLSTIAFLTAVAALGTLLGSLLPPAVIAWLNALVGAALIVFGIRLLIKKSA